MSGDDDNAGARAGGSFDPAKELDEVFDIFDQRTRPGIRRTVKLLSEFNAGKTDEANAALQYLNPALSSSTTMTNRP